MLYGYLRFTLSYGDVEKLLIERGLDISYERVRSWVLKFGPMIARRLRQVRRDDRPDRGQADVSIQPSAASCLSLDQRLPKCQIEAAQRPRITESWRGHGADAMT